MALLEQPIFSTTLTEFLLEVKDGHQICYNLCKTAVLECNLGCLIESLGKKSRATSQGHAVSIGSSILWLKFGEAPSVQTTKNTIFVCLLAVFSPPVSSLMFCNVTLQYDSEFVTYAPHTIGNDVMTFQEFYII